MKKAILLFIIAITVISCTKDEVSTFKADPLATVDFKQAKTLKSGILRSSETDSVHLSALEIVKQTDILRFIDSNGTTHSRGFDLLQRDITSETPMLKMWGTDILYYEQNIDGSYTTNLVLQTEFLEGVNCLLLDVKEGTSVDTLAYIPNTVLRAAEIKIKALFASGEYESIYKLFNDAYTFIPITGAEYKALNQ